MFFGLLSQTWARDLVRIPAQSFDAVDERTNIKVHINVDPFLISPTEVTQQDYEAVTGSNPSEYTGSNLPVQNVSWWDAIRYCNLRSIREGLHPCYDLSTGRCDYREDGYRLPTEVEWRLAAADDGRENTSGSIEPNAVLGNRDTKDVAVLMELVRKGPSPVASHPPNRRGLYDTLGNVWEWCQDFFDPLVSYPQANDPTGPSTGIARVIRGGSFASSTGSWSKGYRSSMDPNQRSRFTGFRICKTASMPHARSADPKNPDWFKRYNQAPSGFETSTGDLSPLLNVNGRQIQTPQQWRQRAAEVKDKWRTLLGSCEIGPAAPSIRVIRAFAGDGYNGTLASLQVEPDSWEDILIMKPDRVAEHPLPAVIVPFYDVDTPAGKDLGGRRYMPPGVESFAALAVHRGWIAVAIRWFGESYGESYSEAVANLTIRHPGCTGIGKWVSDANALVNYLISRPDVDRNRLAIIGHSLGGKMALYASAFDERIAVTVASEPGIGFSHSNYGDYWYFGKRLATAPPGADQHELLGLIAPRPFLLIGGDKFDGNDSWHYINAARQVYTLFGKPQNIGFLDHHQGHTPTPDAVWSAMEWLRSFLFADSGAR